MSELRRLLRDVGERDRAISISLFALVQGLVAAVEAMGVDKHMTSLAYVHTELAEAQATIRKLRVRNKHLSGEINRLAGLLDAYADCPSFDDARQLVYNLRKELAEAKAEIERLLKERDEWAEKAIATAGAATLFVVPNKEFEADAEIGRLVRDIVARKNAFLDTPAEKC